MLELSIEQVFGKIPLDGSLPIQPGFSPDGLQLAFLQQGRDDRERLDLWNFDLHTKTSQELVNVSTMPQFSKNSGRIKTDEEKAEAERRRMFNSGITSYFWHPDGNAILFPVDGALYIFLLASKSVRCITPEGTRQTDFTISPTGNQLTYVRGGELYLCLVADGTETRLTHSASATCTNGLASFIAQEEMHLFEGHWWAPDGHSIVYMENDTSKIPVSQRYEIDADKFHSYSQRYSYAGAQNVRTLLKLINTETMQTRVIQYHTSGDTKQAPYLARVHFTPDSKHLFLQVQSRDQKTLELLAYSIDSERLQTVLKENHSTWINLHNNLRFLHVREQSDELKFLWTSERDDLSQLYLYSLSNNRQPRIACVRVSDGSLRVNHIIGVQNDKVYFTGWRDTPTEQHLFEIGQSENSCAVQITQQPGWHECHANNQCTEYVDCHSSTEHPPSLKLHALAGTTECIIAQNLLNASNAYYPWYEKHSRAQLGQLTARDGQELHFRLTKPTKCISGEQYPVIVYVYGGPGVQRVKNEWCSLVLQVFARAGFGVFELDNRGTSNRCKSFEDPIFGQLGKTEIEDQILGTTFLGSLDWVDPERIGIFGHSYGGYMALTGLYQAPEIFKAGVAVAPVTDWHLYDTHYTERYLGLPEENHAGYLASNILPLRGKLRSKLLVMHGMSDDNVLFTHSTRLFKALQDNNCPFEMMTYPGAKHAMQQQNVMIHRFHTIISFFRRAFY